MKKRGGDKKKQVNVILIYFTEPNMPNLLSFQHGVNIKVINENFYINLLHASVLKIQCVYHM